MSAPRLAAATAVVAVLTTSGVAAAATTPVISKEVLSMRKTAPLTIPGTGVKQGARLPRGAHLVFRTVTLEKGQKVRITHRQKLFAHPAHSAHRTRPRTARAERGFPGAVPSRSGGLRTSAVTARRGAAARRARSGSRP
jgi:hypothetical protein